jgi:hypothetical protein
VEDLLPIADVSGTTAITSIQGLINAIQQMDNILWEVQIILIRVDGYSSLVRRWQDVSLVRTSVLMLEHNC